MRTLDKSTGVTTSFRDKHNYPIRVGDLLRLDWTHVWETYHYEPKVNLMGNETLVKVIDQSNAQSIRTYYRVEWTGDCLALVRVKDEPSGVPSSASILMNLAFQGEKYEIVDEGGEQ